MGYDIDADRVNAVRSRRLYTVEPGVNDMLDNASNLHVTSSLKEAARHSNVIFVTVSTQSTAGASYDVTPVYSVVDDLAALGRRTARTHLIVCCNVSPGCTDNLQKKIEKLNYVVSYNPELVAQGSIIRDQLHPENVIAGLDDDEARSLLTEIHSSVTESSPSFHFMDRLSAEIAKVSLNCFLAVKISFVNMIGDIALSSGCEPERIQAAIGSDSRVGSAFFRYGFGYGGPCLPRDLQTLAEHSENTGIYPHCLRAAEELNEAHHKFQVAEFIRKRDRADPVVIESVTYKPGVTIIDESQQLKFAAEIASAGFDVLVREHPEVIARVKAEYADLFRYEERY